MTQIERARLLANYAADLGAHSASVTPRSQSNHLGAVVADAVLQAGVNYRTVVRGRVARIHATFPETASLDGLLSIVQEDRVSDYLSWSHSIKLQRFASMVALLADERVQTTAVLQEWLPQERSRDRLLSLHGIGPKTYDYMCCLVGIDRIAVDRHVRTFASNAGVTSASYGDLQMVVSYAADLLGLARRDFDAWIWTIVSSGTQSDLFQPAN